MKKKKKTHFSYLGTILLCFVGLSFFLIAERGGIGYQYINKAEAYLPVEACVKAEVSEMDCLILANSEEEVSKATLNQLHDVLTDMRIGYECVDLSVDTFPNLNEYQTVIVAVSKLGIFDESILTLAHWVEQGGRILFASVLEKEKSFDLISNKMGITESDYEHAMVEKISIKDGFMLGCNKTYRITDAYESSLTVRLAENCKVYVEETGSAIPLIWETNYGSGKFVVCNLGFYEKAYRGFYAAAYSLLEEVSVYPVINGSAFYIDDFPSPVPSGNGEYINRDYNMSIANFYSNVWWPDMMQLAETYKLVYTGMIIENYQDQVKGDLVRNTDVSRYQYFGNMLLQRKGELGLHGYNHQPLCTEEFQYDIDIGYQKWESYDKMKESVTELLDFSKGIFPGESFYVYVPPSNILSPEGRRMLGEDFPEIKAIASIYFPGESAYEQEFGIGEDGIVETPRVISGCDIDGYMKIAALSELNMHYVNSHFLHPDDLLDEDRGASQGWERLKEKWMDYLDWLTESAGEIRSLTGSEMAGAVQRYDCVSLNKEITEKEVCLTVNGFYDEAYFFLRMNEGEPGQITGGTLTPLVGDLYLLKAEQEEIRIQRSR